MANQNYGEVLCQAVDEIVRKRLEGIVYDSTILCTIVDNSRKDEGIYVISNNGTTKFEAYSTDTSYRVNDNVYVQIPGGDWNQQKLILAKKKDKTEEPFIYESPFDSLVDITGNLINYDVKENGLLANGDSEQTELWSWSADDLAEAPLTAYSRLGLSGSFQSWLNPFYDENGNIIEVAHGNYGYKLNITTENEKISTDTDDNNEYVLYLNCADMVGNPYNFQSYYHQEKVFDISQIGKIKKMTLYFYQQKNSFTNAAGTAISATDFLGNPIAPNLFTIKPYITLGYDIREFDEEMVTIYSLQPTTYSRTANETYNKKNVYLRWIHLNDDGKFQSINDESKLNYEIYWYRYELGHKSADQYSGVYWKHYARQRKDADWIYETWDEKNGVWNIDANTAFFKTTLNPDVTLQEEKIKAIILYNGKAYRSNVLTLTNEDEVVSKPTVDAVQALSIVADDGTYGNYRIYGQNGSLLDMAQRNDIRTWTAYFKSSLDGEDAEPTILTNAESIEWIIPTEKTMIQLEPEFYQEALQKDNVFWEDGTKRIHIKRYCNADGQIKDVNNQQYKIRSYYSQSYSDNTIQCKIVKDKITYTATKELTFGTAGTTGTDYTFILDFDKGITAVTADSNDAVFVTARLYDYENNEIDISDRKITWSWKGNDPAVDISEDKLLQIYPVYQDEAQLKIKTISCEIKRTATAWSGINYGILQASMDWGDWKLIAYLPIPIRSSTNYSYISGTTQVIYNSAGEIIDCARNPYVLYNNSGAKVAVDISEGWKCYDENGVWETTYNKRSVYAPTIKYTKDTNNNITGYYLSPLSFYVEDACEKICVTAAVSGTIVWSQPILIMQNTYPSAMLNEWDGSLKINESKGAILAPRMVAGMKDGNNKFSGIVLGNWGGTNSDNSLTSGDTGLYGFDKGEQTYAFKQDGTAFIGKDGVGRISFNDSEPGVIESGAYTAGQTGMKINLAEGAIDAHTFTLTAGKTGQYPMGGKNNTILIDTEAQTYPLQIGSNFSVDWDGTLHAAAGDFSGDIEASNINGSTITGGSIFVPKEKPLFKVNDSGYLTATGANITGTIIAEEGQIGDWMISDGSISAGNTTLSSNGGLTTTNGNFEVDANGVLTAKGAKIDGHIEAASGTIGGWYMYEGYKNPLDQNKTSERGWKSLYTLSGGYYTVLDARRDNVIAIGIPISYAFNETNQGHNTAKFRVKQDGGVIIGTQTYTVGTATYLHQPLKLNIDGSINAGGVWNSTAYNTDYSVIINENGLAATKGKLATWNIGESSLWSGASEDAPTLYYGTNGKSFTIGGSQRANIIFKAGSNFGVDNNGKVYANDLNITGGTFTIKNTTNKTIFAIAADGTLTATAGTIGCWSIKDYQLEYNDQASKAMRIGEYGFKYFWHNTHFAVGPADETGSATYYDKPMSVQPYLALNFGSRHGILDISSGGMYFGTNINSDNALGIKMDGSKGYLNGNWELPNDEQVQANKINIATNKTNISTLIDWYVNLDTRVSALEKK